MDVGREPKSRGKWSEEPRQLDESFYDRSPAIVARELIGCGFARRVDGEWLGGWIVETEAYLSRRDAASHSARGMTPGNASMFGPPGTLYVYPIHAKHCVNLVTEGHGVGSAVLIRAIEPVWGVQRLMTNRRQTDFSDRTKTQLTTGPGRLCQAMQIDRRCDGKLPQKDANWQVFQKVPVAANRISKTARIGVSQSAERKLRFFLDGNRFVSGLARQHRRPRRDSIEAEFGTLPFPFG
ncbi:DNA-3-methyladenine glycosylase [Rhodopirellula halodulae]|uniref:DNA-3-methyladenine glycosylase n=1 Tax=Rhodopirellula halodulae TaxID=2894198 RepID=UPI001E33024D|nr:DNA-3-methyladenine glycosylase [Rhodopirellula sp. JC737]MCC9657254.1 DNA-3-methyladenine glycosylase [Rhodopirellula sp. JC737]